VAAARAGRNSIGIEIDPAYYTLAQDRLTNVLPSITVKRTAEFLKW